MSSEDDEWRDDNDEWLYDDECDNDDFWEETDYESELLEVYDSPEDALIDMCSAPGVIADFAPPHAVLEFLTTAIEKLGHDPKAAEGRRILLAVAQEVFPHPSPLEQTVASSSPNALPLASPTERTSTSRESLVRMSD